ncbi:MAG TPA: glycosyltransferase family 9 protein [Ktedonobacterales bacterium]|nr:glycosyltransferase family 9 protein [Ktedonobacterales bacterium]
MVMILGKQLGTSVGPALGVLVHRLHGDALLRNSVYVMTTTALTAASGYLYWIIAARMYPAHEVGLASALIGTMMLAAMLANLGIGPTLIQVLPRQKAGHQWSLTLNAVLAIGLLASLVTGSAAAMLLPILSPKFAVVGHQGGYTLALIAGVPLLTLAALLDSAFMAERAGGNMLARTATFALLRIPLLVGPVLLGQAGALVICMSWFLAAGGSLVGGALLVRRLGRAYRVAMRGIVAQMRSMLSLVAGHQLISLGSTAPIYLLPVIVVARLSLAENAYFYTSWQVGSLFFMVSPSVAVALLAEGSHAPQDLYRKARASALIIGVLLCPVMLMAGLGGHLILSVFGPDYALNGYSLLVILVASAIPDAITNVYVATLRVQKRLAVAALLNLGMATLTLVLAWLLLPRLSIAGAGWAWLIAQTAGTIAVAAHAMLTGSRSRAIGRWRRQTKAASDACTRILLIVDPCSVGEALRIAPYVTMVRRRYPHAHITLVANNDALKGLERAEEYDRAVQSKVYLYRPFSRVRVRVCQVWAWLGLVWQLGVGYDLVITFYWGGIFQHLLGYAVSRGRRVGYAHYPAPLARWLLSSRLGPFRWTESHPPQHAALLRAAGIEVEAAEVAQPRMRYTDHDRAVVSNLLRERGLTGSQRLIVLHPGSDWACQQWLQERWWALADALVAHYKAAIVFTGTANEAAYVERIRRRMTAPSHSLVGQTTLPQMAALLTHSLLCICVDSAVFELTQAAGTPAVVLAGPSRPDTGVYGASRPIVVRRMNDYLAGMIAACQDRHNGLNETGCWNYHCWMSGLRDISVADVLRAVEDRIQLGLPEPHTGEDELAQEADALALHPVLEDVFSAFNREHIAWCVLRGETELANPDDDVDLLVAPGDLPHVRAILGTHRFAALPSWGRGAHVFFIGYHAPTETWITLDIVTELTYGPYLNLRTHAAAGCLARRRPAGPLYLLAPDDGFWTLFLHCTLDKKAFAPHRAARLQEQAAAARTDGPLARLSAMACPEGWNAARLVESVRHGAWDTLAGLAPALRAGWRRREPARAWWWSTANRSLRLVESPLVRLRRPGLSVALLGPDGAGKSTLAAEIQRTFHFPVRSVYMGLWKSGRAHPDAAAKPHPRGLLWPARRGLEIIGRLPKAWRCYLVARCHQVLGRMVIFDRYVYDALIPAHQSPERLKRLYMWLLGHSCPAPDLVLMLDAPGEVMFARKGERSPQVLESQRQGLLALRDRIPHAQIVDVTREEAVVRDDVLSRIWSAYCSRWNDSSESRDAPNPGGAAESES